MYTSPTGTRKQANFTTSGQIILCAKNNLFIYLVAFCYLIYSLRIRLFTVDLTEKQVFDARGVDVTPRPLYHPDPHTGTAKPSKLLTSQEGSLGSDFISSYSLYQNTVNPSMLGQFTRERNKNYKILCRNRLGNDLYVERMMQTFNGAPKNKEVQCEKIIMEEKDSETSSLMDIENVILARVHDDEEDHSEAILKSEKLQQDLFFMERVLMENVFQQKLAAYRQLPVLKEREPGEPEEVLEEELEVAEEEIKKEDDEGMEMELDLEITTEQSTIPANLERLWSFTCDLTKGLNVSSLAWNKANPDLLAVGYGNFGFKEQKRGMACCWSIKNPMDSNPGLHLEKWPERIYQSPHGVTSVDFSIGSPNLLAVGYYNGTIAIYNVQSSSNTPVLDN
ncbi:hypothetical protein STEG23_030061, partial [Scotinomys teguina]